MKQDGFSFIEVLFALFIAGLTALAVGGTVIGALRAEGRAQTDRTAAHLWTTLQTRLWLGDAAPETLVDADDWQVTTAVINMPAEAWPDDSPPPDWTRYGLHPPRPHRTQNLFLFAPQTE